MGRGLGRGLLAGAVLALGLGAAGCVVADPYPGQIHGYEGYGHFHQAPLTVVRPYHHVMPPPPPRPPRPRYPRPAPPHLAPPPRPPYPPPPPTMVEAPRRRHDQGGERPGQQPGVERGPDHRPQRLAVPQQPPQHRTPPGSGPRWGSR